MKEKESEERINEAERKVTNISPAILLGSRKK
jgi:hypothetical protein